MKLTELSKSDRERLGDGINNVFKFWNIDDESIIEFWNTLELGIEVKSRR